MARYRKHFFIFTIIIVHFSLTFSQEKIEYTSEPRNFYDFINQKLANYDIDTSEGSQFKYLKRVEKMWGDRLYPTGFTYQMGEGITQYVRNYEKIYKECFSHPWTEIGPIGKPRRSGSSGGSGQIHAITLSPKFRQDSVIYAASNWGGLWKKVGSQPWYMLNTDTKLPFTSVSDMAIHNVNTDLIYISTGDAEMSLGHHAQNLDGTPSKMTPLFTSGVYFSNDGGKNWAHFNGKNHQLLDYFVDGGTIYKIKLHPNKQEDIYIATSEGIFFTSYTQGKAPSWKRIFYIPNEQELKGFEFRPNHPSTIYASGRDIYRSTNGGKKWSSMTGKENGLDLKNLKNDFIVYRINIAVTPANDKYLYAYIVGSSLYNNTRIPSLYLYLFDGNSWRELSYQEDRSGSALISPTRTAIVCSAINPHFLVYGREQLWGHQDITKTNVKLSGYNSGNFHADIHAIAFSPDEDFLYLGTDGGVHTKIASRMDTGGGVDISEGLGVKTIYKFDDSQDRYDHIIIGSQDTGTDVFKDNEWTFIDGGDGYNGKIDDVSGLAFYNTNGRLRSYDWNINHSYEHLLPTDPTTSENSWLRGTFEMKNHPYDRSMIFSMSELYSRNKNTPALRTDNANELWTLRSDIGKYISDQWRRQLTVFDVSSSNTNYWYVAASGVQVDDYHASFIVEPRLFRSKIGGCMGVEDYYEKTCFEEITQKLVNSGIHNKNYQGKFLEKGTFIPVITSVVFDPNNHNRAWITFSGYQEGIKVWHTEDNGETWKNADPFNSLANLPVNHIVYQSGTNDRLYIGTDAGVYTKDGKDMHWRKFCQFPNAIVSHIKINYCIGKIRVSTFGRGMWEADLLSDALESTADREIPNLKGEKFANNLILENNIYVSKNDFQLSLEKYIDPISISMPKNSMIILSENGTLLLNKHKITNHCGEKWNGIWIEVKKEENKGKILNPDIINRWKYGF